jgi:hypothetical protein
MHMLASGICVIMKTVTGSLFTRLGHTSLPATKAPSVPRYSSADPGSLIFEISWVVGIENTA